MLVKDQYTRLCMAIKYLEKMNIKILQGEKIDDNFEILRALEHLEVAFQDDLGSRG